MRADEAVIDEAAQWLALLQSGEVSLAERAAFEAWRVADPRHQQIIEQMGGGLNLLRNPTLRGLPRNSLLHSLNAPSSRRRFISGSLSVLGVALLAGLLGRRFGWLPEAGELATGTGEREEQRRACWTRLVTRMMVISFLSSLSTSSMRIVVTGSMAMLNSSRQRISG